MKFGGKLRTIWVIAVFAAHPITASAFPPARKLTRQQAISLAKTAVDHQMRNIHPRGKYSLEPMARENDQRFISFEALAVWDPARVGSAVIGNYSVDLTTGRVWDDSSCEEIRFRQLELLRQRYIHALGEKDGREREPLSCRDA
jgi:hypothetical protein